MLKNIKEKLEIEFSNYFVWIPVCLSFGILIYFQLPTEPYHYIGLISSIALFVLTIFSRHKYDCFRVMLLLFCIALGFVVAQFKTHMLRHEPITAKTEKLWLKGKVSQIQHMQTGKRVILTDIKVYDDNQINLGKVRINIKSYTENLDIGDIIKVQAVLMPPPKPVIPGGFDFARYAYFKELSAIGYATSKIRIYKKAEGSLITFFAHLRNKVIEKVRANLTEPKGGIANGILVGDSSSIPKSDYDIIRIAGIAHLLAISGMHMVVVVTILFISTRFLILRSEYLALRVDAKKVAAIIALLGSTIYLFLTLAPVSAERAYIMSSIILLAIILDHNSSAIRAVVIAAIIILLITPQEILNPSLQMSFIASLALISGFSFFYRFSMQNSGNPAVKIINYFISIVIATLIAGFATAPFIIYHFNQFSPYSVLANLIAIPINDFWVMPFGLISLLLMPMGLEKPALIPMGWGIEGIFKTAEIISELPYSSFNVESFSDIGIFLIGFGSVGLFISVTSLRLLFIVPILIGCFLKSPYAKPDILIESEKKIFAIRVGDELIFSSKRGAGFTREVWQQAYRQKEQRTLKQVPIPLCSANSCLYKKYDTSVLIYSDGSIECNNNINIVINLSSKELSCNRGVQVIDLDNLKQNGNLAVWLSQEGAKFIYSDLRNKLRPWNEVVGR